MTEIIIFFGRDRAPKDYAHIPFEEGRAFVETGTTKGSEFEALVQCVEGAVSANPDATVVVGVLSKADFGRGMGQVNCIKAITKAGGAVRVFEPKGGKPKRTPKRSGRKSEVALTADQEAAVCAIWSNTLIREADRLARIKALDGVPALDKAQVYYICVTKPKRANAKAK